MKKKSDLNITISEKDVKLKIIDGVKAYAQLSAAVNKEGILDRDYVFYTAHTSFILLGFFATLAVIYFTQNLYIVTLLCLVFGFFAVQIAGLVHDAGHRTVFNSTKNNDLFGYFCSAFVVIPFSRWKTRHNAHHANPNEEGEDPDINIPVVSFTEEHLRSRSKFERSLLKYQAYIYYPILTLTAFAERNIQFIFNGDYSLKKKNTVELILFIFGFCLWFVVPFLVFPFAKAAIVFLVSNLMTGFYIGNIFAPNHKGMPEVKKGVKLSFFEHQIITTRNVRGSKINDLVYMGLNYQMEHHLFPNCPRNKLKLITPHLKKMCKQMGLEYTETGVIESNKIIVSELNKIAAAAA
ncbi:acyl-CoA desaturase [Candidatus Woesebacteria bacterium]|nr:acyl-CoA desaturase [Candidatus Woesebacteria bacterium]